MLPPAPARSEPWVIYGPKPQVIYGSDGRRDVFQESDPRKRLLARSSVAMISSSLLHRTRDGHYRIATTSYRDAYNLCPTERFLEQPVAADCSGFLVGPDLVATAGHCVPDRNECRRLSYVFDYAYLQRGSRPETVDRRNVYSCRELVVSRDSEDGPDFAIIRLDRAVRDRRPLPLRRQGAPRLGDEIFVVGYPSGLPAKIATGARIRAVQTGAFTSNLDVYEGNSGSAVLNATTFMVEGVLVRGEEDFVMRNQCAVSKRCADHECEGEDATAIAELLPWLPSGK